MRRCNGLDRGADSHVTYLLKYFWIVTLHIRAVKFNDLSLQPFRISNLVSTFKNLLFYLTLRERTIALLL